VNSCLAIRTFLFSPKHPKRIQTALLTPPQHAVTTDEASLGCTSLTRRHFSTRKDKPVGTGLINSLLAPLQSYTGS